MRMIAQIGKLLPASEVSDTLPSLSRLSYVAVRPSTLAPSSCSRILPGMVILKFTDGWLPDGTLPRSPAFTVTLNLSPSLRKPTPSPVEVPILSNGTLSNVQLEPTYLSSSNALQVTPSVVVSLICVLDLLADLVERLAAGLQQLLVDPESACCPRPSRSS